MAERPRAVTRPRVPMFVADDGGQAELVYNYQSVVDMVVVPLSECEGIVLRHLLQRPGRPSSAVELSALVSSAINNDRPWGAGYTAVNALRRRVKGYGINPQTVVRNEWGYGYVVPSDGTWDTEIAERVETVRSA